MFDSLSVLILEDEPIIGFALEDILLEIGFADVALVSNIPAAHQAIEAEAPDAAVLDVNIHGERSYAVADALSARKVPFVFATGYGDAEHPEAHRSVPTVTKPYSSEDIRSALAAALGAS